MIQTNLPDFVFAAGNDWPAIPMQVVNDFTPWGAGVTYAIGDVVSFGGVLYTCTAGNTNQQPPNAGYWSVGGGVDITGWANIVFNVYPPGTSTTPVLSQAITIDTAASGLIHVPSVAAALTANCANPSKVSAAQFFWKVLRTDSGYVRELGFGIIPIRF